MTSLARQAGRLFMVGFEADDGAVCTALRAGRAGGVVLFARNIESAAQVRALTARLRNAAGFALPIAVDQEGGTVARLAPAGIANGPLTRSWATLDPVRVYDWGVQTARQLTSLGFSVNFAPVLDVDSNLANPIIGTRAYGTTPDQVVRFAGAAARGLTDGGVTPCAKHFPGHGDTDQDSHLQLPTVHRSLATLQQTELAPFAALLPAMPLVMTAHVLYPAWDASRPATLSPKILKGVLRQQLGYDGVVVSDDMEMRAVADHHSPESLAIQSVIAGVDMVLICRSQKFWEAAYEGLLRAAERDASLRQCIALAYARIVRLWPS